MISITRWHLVRHAPVATATDAQDRIYKSADEPADTSDKAAFAALARRLPAGALMVTSGLKRTEATANALIDAGYQAAGRMVDGRLAEQHYGDWYGRTDLAFQSAPATGERHKFWFTAADTCPPGGERFLDVIARVRAALTEIGTAHDGRKIVAVTHGGVIRAALAIALELDPERALAISAEPLSATRIDHAPGPGRGGDWRLVYVNMRP